MRVVVTGAGGFIGRAICAQLAGAGHVIRGTSRHAVHDPAVGEWVRLDLSDPDAGVDAACRGMDAVVHLAAHVHVGAAGRLFNAERFRRVNVAGTEALAGAALRAGVRRFVFLSSIGVNGTASPVVDGVARRISERDAPSPRGAYARSKQEAERVLERMQAGTPMRVVSLRTPLVFGPGVGANFLALMRWVRSGLPVPVRGDAARSLICTDNIADLVLRCVEAPEGSGGVRVVRDFDYAIDTLVARIASAMRVPARLWRLADGFAETALRVPVAGSALAKLTRPLLIDDARIRSELSWSPRVDADTAIARTVEAFLPRGGAA